MNSLPELPTKLLVALIKRELAEEVLGDLEEKFYQTLRRESLFKAKLNYWYQVFNYLRPFAIKKYRSNLINNNMQLHYFKIGYRNLSRNKGYSFINIGGLAMGMAVAMLIGMWVYDEFSFNKYHDNYDKIGQVMFHGTFNGELETNAVVCTGLGTYIKETYPNKFDKAVLLRWRFEERLISYKNDHYLEDGYFIQPEGLEMFSFDLISGTYDGLNDLQTIMLSESFAKRIFGEEDPVGEVIQFNEQGELTVTGVYKDIPRNSKFAGAEYLAPLDVYLYGWADLNVWDNQNMFLFLQLNEGVSWSEASALIKDAYNPHRSPDRQVELFVHPMSEWHLNSEFENGQLVANPRVTIIWLYSAIGLAVLLLACVNFMNLSTARSENRAREVGVRKSMGSKRAQLIYQFLSESILVAFLSFLLSLGLVALFMDSFNDIAGKDMGIPWNQPLFWLAGISFTLITGMLAGSYPALFLSGFNAVRS